MRYISRAWAPVWVCIVVVGLGFVLAPTQAFAQAERPMRVAQASQSILKVKAPLDGARVFLNGEDIGATPLIKMVDPGTYNLRVTHPQYDEFRQVLTVISGQAVSIDASMQSRVGVVVVSSTADPATVFLDGEEVGQTPDLVLGAVLAGEHAIRVEKPGHLTYAGTVRVQAGLKLKLNVQLRANAAEVTVVSDPAGAEIFIDGVSFGFAPQTIPTVTGGRHGLMVKAEGRSTVYRSFQVRVGDKIDLSVEVPAEGGQLQVSAKPADAQVFLEGVLIGQAPVHLEDLAPGPYALRVTAEGYADYVETVSVAAGRKSREKAKLISASEFDKVAFDGGDDTVSTPLVKRKWFWPLVGGVVAASVGGATWWYFNQSGGVVEPGDVAVTLP